MCGVRFVCRGNWLLWVLVDGVVMVWVSSWDGCVVVILGWIFLWLFVMVCSDICRLCESWFCYLLSSLLVFCIVLFNCRFSGCGLLVMFSVVLVIRVVSVIVVMLKMCRCCVFGVGGVLVLCVSIGMGGRDCLGM